MSDDSSSLLEEERSLFRPFTRESLLAIDARIADELEKQKELEKRRAEGEVRQKSTRIWVFNIINTENLISISIYCERKKNHFSSWLTIKSSFSLKRHHENTSKSFMLRYFQLKSTLKLKGIYSSRNDDDDDDENIERRLNLMKSFYLKRFSNRSEQPKVKFYLNRNWLRRSAQNTSPLVSTNGFS